MWSGACASVICLFGNVTSADCIYFSIVVLNESILSCLIWLPLLLPFFFIIIFCTLYLMHFSRWRQSFDRSNKVKAITHWALDKSSSYTFNFARFRFEMMVFDTFSSQISLKVFSTFSSSAAVFASLLDLGFTVSARHLQLICMCVCVKILAAQMLGCISKRIHARFKGFANCVWNVLPSSIHLRSLYMFAHC